MNVQDVLYCNVGDMRYYNGVDTERPVGGGAYNNSEIGYEANNYTEYNGKYYGFVQSSSHTIAIESHFSDLSADMCLAKHVLVVWLVKKSIIVGWYNDATVYRDWQIIDKNAMKSRIHPEYNVVSSDVVLLPLEDRIQIDYKVGRNIGYADPETNKKVIEIIEKYEGRKNKEALELGSADIKGTERETVIKQRVNQSYFRQKLLVKYNGKCALCGTSVVDLLVASHIKPWSESSASEKVDVNNGLLLCPAHDKLFDKGYITFDDNGKITISDIVSAYNCEKMNVSDDMHIEMSEKMQKYIEYHRNNKYRR